MSHSSSQKAYTVDRGGLPENYPAHLLSDEFCTALGRCVASFGFLEDVIGRAIFALTGSQDIAEEYKDAALVDWQKTLLKALSDPLGSLIIGLGKALREHPRVTLSKIEIDELVSALRSAAERRNVLCHGSWSKPNYNGAALPRFVTPKGMIFDTLIDAEHLHRVQQHVAELICAVMDSVTLMGLQFPGSTGPGRSVWPSA